MEWQYLDIKAQGGLAKLLQTHLNAIGSPLKLRGAGKDGGGSWAFAKSSVRLSQVSMSSRECLFMSDFWEHGVILGNFWSDSPQEIAPFLDAWIVRTVSPRQLCQEFPAAKMNDHAEAYIAGAAEYVEWQWQRLLAATREDRHFAPLAPVVELAHAHPVLGRLRPFTSHWKLLFSRCTGYPFVAPCPAIVAMGDDLFATRHPRSKELIKGDAAAMINFVEAYLPSNCGPAVHGTADDFATD